MKKIIIFLLGLTLISCSKELDIDGYDDRSIIKYNTFGEFGGVYTFENPIFSAEGKRIAFTNIKGIQDASSLFVGEMNIDGEIIWQKNSTNFTYAKVLSTPDGIFLYGKNNVEKSHLCKINTFNQKFKSVYLPLNMSSIEYIHNLGNSNYLLFREYGNRIYFNEIKIDNVNDDNWTLQLYDISFTYMDIFHVEESNDGCIVLGLFQTDTDCSIKCIKCNIITKTVELLWERKLVEDVYNLRVNACKDGNNVFLAVSYTTEQYSNYYNGFIKCISYSQGTNSWQKNTSRSKYNAIIADGNQLFVIGSSTKLNNNSIEMAEICKMDKNGSSYSNKNFDKNSEFKDILIKDSYIYLFGIIDKVNEDWFISTGYKGWFLKLKRDLIF